MATATTSQNRIMQTYRVDLLLSDGTVFKSADVNLSFMLDADNSPLDSNGRPLGDAVAAVELVRRLRKLAKAKRIPVTNEDLDACDWSAPRIVRQRFVTVEVDETGRAVKGVRS